MKKIAIIGFGGSGYHAADEFRKYDTKSVVDIYSDTQSSSFNPMLTTYYVKNTIPYDAMFPYGSIQSIADSLNANIIGERVLRIDENRNVYTESGVRQYDKLMIATGATPTVPAIKGAEFENVFTIRTEQDALFLKERLNSGNVRAGLVYGASWSGIKIIEDFVEYGVPCTLMNRSRHSFSKALFAETAERVERDMEDKGIQLAFGETLTEIVQTDDGRLAAITQSGKRFEADLIAITSGVAPNLEIVSNTGIQIGKGITVDAGQETSIPGIYAAGDCCDALNTQNGKKQNIGLWLNAVQQGRVAGANMAGMDMRFGANVPVSLAHYLHYDFISIGDAKSVEEGDTIFEDENERFYIRAVRNRDRIKCINLIGNADIGGIIKNIFIKSVESPGAPLSALSVCQLKAKGIPEQFISFLGGVCFD